MPNKNYLRGRRFEWSLKKEYEDMGYHVVRTAGSHGAYDLIAMKDANGKTEIHCIQCKVIPKYSMKAIEKLRKDSYKKSPLKAAYFSDECDLFLTLAIKVHGESGYSVVPLEP